MYLVTGYGQRAILHYALLKYLLSTRRREHTYTLVLPMRKYFIAIGCISAHRPAEKLIFISALRFFLTLNIIFFEVIHCENVFYSLDNVSA